MWILMFAVVLGIALGFGLGAVLVESYEEAPRPYGRKPVRNL
jgi:hypothetical protein